MEMMIVLRFYSQMLCTAATNTSNTIRTQTGITKPPEEDRATAIGNMHEDV